MNSLKRNNDCNKSCGFVTEVQELAELPIDNLPTPVDYFLTERAVLDESTGKVLHTITRLAGNKVIPNGNLANTFTLDSNNPDLTIPEGQVVPCYVRNNGATNTVYVAGSNNPAVFLAVGTYGDLLLCQSSGVVNILGGHNYIIGVDYYTSSTAGQVTTNATETGQYLFTPVSDTQLVLNIQRQ